MRRHQATPTKATSTAETEALDTTTHDWIERIGRRIAAVEASKERGCHE
jgi:hypothetical protein